MTVVFLKNSLSILAPQELSRSRQNVEKQERDNQTSYRSDNDGAVISRLRLPEKRENAIRTMDVADKLVSSLEERLGSKKELALSAHSQSQAKRALDFLHL